MAKISNYPGCHQRRNSSVNTYEKEVKLQVLLDCARALSVPVGFVISVVVEL